MPSQISILQLSDFHLGERFRGNNISERSSEECCDKLLEFILERLEPRSGSNVPKVVDVLVLNGDLTRTGDENEFSLVDGFL